MLSLLAAPTLALASLRRDFGFDTSFPVVPRGIWDLMEQIFRFFLMR
eukprot:COSAG02_NODE_2152_length_9655_cov_6.433654_7_plen_47_part_00